VRKSNGKVYTYYYWNPGAAADREGIASSMPNADNRA